MRKSSNTIADLDLDTIVKLLKSYTDFFHLVNQAEQLEIIRINRKRAVAASSEEPRKSPIAQAIYLLKKAGTSYEDVLASFVQAGHPTYAYGAPHRGTPPKHHVQTKANF